jgi:hypothetical protein
MVFEGASAVVAGQDGVGACARHDLKLYIFLKKYINILKLMILYREDICGDPIKISEFTNTCKNPSHHLKLCWTKQIGKA